MANFGYYPAAGLDEVVRGGGPLTGIAPATADWGYDPATGIAYYKDAAGEWQKFIAGAQEIYRYATPDVTPPSAPQDPTKPALAISGDSNQITHYWDPTSSSWELVVGGGGTVVENAATGTVDVTASAVTGNAILSIPEQTTIAAGTVDRSQDYVTIWDFSQNKHVRVPVQELGIGIVNNWYETVTAAAPALTDTVTLSHNAPQNPHYGGMWLHNGVIYSWGNAVKGMANTPAVDQAPGNTPSPLPQPADPYKADGTAIGYIPVFSKFWGNRYCAFALDQNQKLWYKGWNNSRQSGIPALGTGSILEMFTLVDWFVTNNVNVVDVALGSSDYAFTDYTTAVFAIDDTGKLYAWGANTWGQLGRGSTTDQATPAQVTLPVGTVVVKAAVSSNSSGQGVHSGVLANDGKLYLCGYNAQGQLGLGNTTQQTLFQLSNSSIADFALSAFDTYAITATGSVVATGQNANGQHGRGITTSTNVWLNATSFTGVAEKIIPLVHGVTGVFVYIVDDLKRLWTAGGNGSGQLGLGGGNVTQQNSFTMLSALQAPFQTHIKEAWVTGNNGGVGLVVTDTGELWTVGHNQYGGRGVGTRGDTAAIRSTWMRVGIPTAIVTCRPAAEQTTGTFLAVDENNDIWTAGYVDQIPNGNGWLGAAQWVSQPVKVMWTRNVGTQTTTPTTGPVTVVTNVDGSVTIDAGAGGSAIVEPFAQDVYVGQANPNVVSPTTFPVEGDFYIQTSDGTVTGLLQSSWVYDGDSGTWIMHGSVATAVAAPAGSPRSYYPATTAYIPRYDALQTAANVTAQGFVGVGGATVAPYGPVFAGKYLLTCNAAVATPATAFTVPTSYVRHEVAITPSVANTYFIKALGDREHCNEVWVCNPTTGVPVKRLASKGVAQQVAGIKNTIQLSPLEEYGSDGDNWEWLGFEIPPDLVATYKTATNTLKLALRPGVNNGEGNQWYMAGWAVASNGIGVTVNNCFSHDNILNGGTQLVYGGAQDGMSYWSVGAGATINGIRVALPRIDKDVYLSVVALANPGNRMAWVDVTIAHASGNIALGRPKPHIKAPLADSALSDVSNISLSPSGWLIPQATLAAKAVQPTNSGVYYLELNLQNRNPGQVAYGTSWVVETVN